MVVLFIRIVFFLTIESYAKQPSLENIMNLKGEGIMEDLPRSGFHVKLCPAIKASCYELQWSRWVSSDGLGSKNLTHCLLDRSAKNQYPASCEIILLISF